ncbi:MAG: hypothetical protein PHF00_01805 [Elusimicrobia bacterium]|nr:hypothetical protein [Elusimicrobiota bacterium]
MNVKEMRCQALREKIAREGYVSPAAAPVETRMSGENYCAARYSFSFLRRNEMACQGALA